MDAIKQSSINPLNIVMIDEITDLIQKQRLTKSH